MIYYLSAGSLQGLPELVLLSGGLFMVCFFLGPFLFQGLLGFRVGLGFGVQD